MSLFLSIAFHILVVSSSSIHAAEVRTCELLSVSRVPPEAFYSLSKIKNLPVSADTKVRYTKVKGLRAVEFHTAQNNGCIFEELYVNYNNELHTFFVTSDTANYRKMRSQLRKLIREPWGKANTLYRI